METFATADRELMAQVTLEPRYRRLSTIPGLALPTFAILVGGYALWAGAIGLWLAGRIPYWLALPVAGFGIFWTFTPLHDAVHRSVSRHRWLNELLGFFGALLLLPGITARIYRYLHLEHHRHTGDEKLDPDDSFVTAKGIRAPLSWIGIDIIWTLFYLRNWRTRPRSERLEFVAGLTVYVGVHVAFLLSPYAWEFLLGWMLPQRLGILIVVYFFAHIQHPEGVLQRQHAFQGTVMIEGRWPVRAFLLGQNEHLMHHLFPSVPFYRYHDVWKLGEPLFRRQQLVERPLLARNNPVSPPERNEPRVPARVESVRDGGGRVKVVTFVPAGDALFGPFTPGAHVDLHLTDTEGVRYVRQYSLINSSDDDPGRYVIAVQREDEGRGGSKAVHQLAAGDTLDVGQPRNRFPLETASDVTLIGGGIGITPLLAMARALDATSTPYALHHCVRDGDAPKAEILSEGALTAVEHPDRDGRPTLDPAEVLGDYQPGRLAYVCGPRGFMDWLLDEAGRLGWPAHALRTESFAPYIDEGPRHAFRVKLARSGRTLEVPPDRTLLSVLEEARAGVPGNCLNGICGACQTPVLAGEIDHRDLIQTPEERRRNDMMQVCVSRAKGDALTLDL